MATWAKQSYLKQQRRIAARKAAQAKLAAMHPTNLVLTSQRLSEVVRPIPTFKAEVAPNVAPDIQHHLEQAAQYKVSSSLLGLALGACIILLVALAGIALQVARVTL